MLRNCWADPADLKRCILRSRRRAIVHPEPLLMTAGQMEIVEGSTVGAQLVGDYQLGCEALLPEQLAHEPQGGALIAPALNQYVEDLALVIDGTPQIHPLAGD